MYMYYSSKRYTWYVYVRSDEIKETHLLRVMSLTGVLLKLQLFFFVSLSLQLLRFVHNCKIVFVFILFTVKQTVVVFLVSDICSDLSKPPSSFKLPLLTGWKLGFKFVAKVTTC